MSEIEASPWSLKGQEFVHSNRAYAREGEPPPPPPAGASRAVVGLYIENGRYGETELSGLSLALVAEWHGDPAPGGDRVGVRPAEPRVDRVRCVEPHEHRVNSAPGRRVLAQPLRWLEETPMSS